MAKGKKKEKDDEYPEVDERIRPGSLAWALFRDTLPGGGSDPIDNFDPNEKATKKSFATRVKPSDK